MAFGKTVVWPRFSGPPPAAWLWGRRTDLLWVAGGGFFVFTAVVLPFTFWAPSAGLMTTLFLHLAIVCNYPHYSATYQAIFRERHTRPRAFKVLLYSTPVLLAAGALVATVPDLFWGVVVRLYLCWSAHHYSAQNFGISAMWAARGGKPLQGRAKSFLQVAFLGLGLSFIVASNTVGGDPESAAKVVGLAQDGGAIPIANLPPFAYWVAMVIAALSVASFLLAERMQSSGLGPATRLLFITSFAWFVLPNIHGPNGLPWMWPGLRLALLGAPPFFHCAQYLAVIAHRHRQSGDVRPIFLFAGLVFGGFALFHAPPHLVPRLFPIDGLRGTLLVVALINLHHFWLDGVMWRRPKQAPAPAAPAVSPA